MSGSIRLFVMSPLREGGEVLGSPAQAHYLMHVMRRAPGDPVVLFNGRDGEWHASIAALKGNKVVIAVESLRRTQAAGADMWLAFGLLKRDATDLVVRMATELGVAALLPVTTERTNAARANLERLAAIATEAAEQCERLTVPDIREPVPLPALLRAWPASRRLYAALERAGGSRPAAPVPASAGLLIGPEGGFAGRELDVLGACAFVVPLSLGPLILRAETAAVAGLALLQASAAGGGCIPTA